MEKCPNCGIDFNNTLGYCPSCGTKVTKKKTEPPKPQVRIVEPAPPKQVQCAYCGTMVDSKLTSCPSCGAAIEKNENCSNGAYSTQGSITGNCAVSAKWKKIACIIGILLVLGIIGSNLDEDTDKSTVTPDNVQTHNKYTEQQHVETKTVENDDVKQGNQNKNESLSAGDADTAWATGKQLYRAKKYLEAKEYFVKAAENGNVEAMTKLGIMYKYGIGVSQNDAEAFDWYHKAAENGDKDAMNRLGAMYKYGWGTSQNPELAVRWFSESAERGNPTAMYNLGTMYQSGMGIQKNESEAIDWYRKAAQGGNKDAVKKLNQLCQ